MEWKGALKRLNEMQPAVSETGLPLCVPLLAHFEVPRLIAALLSALSTAPEKRNAIVKANAEMNSLCDRSPQLASLKRAVLLLRALQQPTLDAVNYLAVSPSRPLLFQRTLSSFKLAIRYCRPPNFSSYSFSDNFYLSNLCDSNLCTSNLSQRNAVVGRSLPILRSRCPL